MSKEEILWLFVFIFILYIKSKRQNMLSSFNELHMSNKNKLNPLYLFLGCFLFIYLMSYMYTFVNNILPLGNNRVIIWHLNCNNNIHIFYDLNCLAIILHRTIMAFIFVYISYDILVFFQLIESNINKMRNYSFKELILENHILLYYIKRFSYTLLFNYLINYIACVINYRIIDTPMIIFNFCNLASFSRLLLCSVIMMVLDFFARKYTQNEEFRKYVKRFIYIFVINHLTLVTWTHINVKSYNLSKFISTLFLKSNILLGIKFSIIVFICDFFIKRARTWEY